MSNLVAYLLRIITRRERSVEAILSPISRIVRDLEAKAKLEAERSAKDVERAIELQRQAEARKATADRAAAKASNISSLFAD